MVLYVCLYIGFMVLYKSVKTENSVILVNVNSSVFSVNGSSLSRFRNDVVMVNLANYIKFIVISGIIMGRCFFSSETKFRIMYDGYMGGVCGGRGNGFFDGGGGGGGEDMVIVKLVGFFENGVLIRMIKSEWKVYGFCDGFFS